MARHWMFGGNSVILVFALAQSAAAAPPAKVEDALAFRPHQPGVDYETPPKEKFSQCKVEVEKRAKGSGLVVLGPDGQVLRRFVDTDGDKDKHVDQWRYFKDGIEVYREIDTNKNNKPDNFRWLNLGGSRWGVDVNEDGKIDAWKSLSAAEASQEAIRAVASGDDEAFQALLLTVDDIKKLDIDRPVAEKLLAAVQDAPKKARALVSKSKVLTSQSKWMRFDALMPGVIPADDGKAGTDLMVYENAMAIVETGKTTGLVQIGEMIRVGDVWKITQAPLPIESDKPEVMAGGILMQPIVSENAPVAGAPSPEMQKVLEKLEKLDKNPPALSADKVDLAKYNNQRADLLVEIYNLAESSEEKTQWMKQLIDSLAASIQTGAFPQGLARLKALEGQLRAGSKNSPLVPYAAYRRIFAEYTLDLKDAETDKRSEVLNAWLKGLEDFIKTYPEADDTPDAMLQLAMNDEFMGKNKEAEGWYQRIVADKSKTTAAKKAQGAITRLSLKNKAITISGPGLKGGNISSAGLQNQGVVLVMYWVTWYQPGLAELPDLRALYNQYHGEGFEIIGVSLDIDKQAVEQYVAQNKITWPQIYQPGGLDSPLAVQYGIFSPPVMFLLDKSGKVISRNITVAELKQQLPQLLKGK